MASVFDNLHDLELSAADMGGGGSREIVAHVSLGKPKQEFVRVNPAPNMSLTTSVFLDKSGMRNEPYLVLPGMRGALLGETRAALIVPYQNLQGANALWLLQLPTDDARRNAWYETARQAMELAKTRWVRISADLSLGAYRIHEATGDHPEPDWPETPLNELLEVAFRGRVIDTVDHPLVRRLQGATA